MSIQKTHLKIRRQDSSKATAHWENFQVELPKESTVLDALTHIRKKPVNQRGESVTPVAWESSCGFESCGSCLMVINGQVRTACAASLGDLGQTIVLQPLKKFPVVRDLVVDRSRVFEGHSLMEDAVGLDFSDKDFAGIPQRAGKISDNAQKILTDCINCGACLDACPRYGDSFMGAAPVLHALVFDSLSPTQSRSRELMAGVADCDNARNCEQACPKDIPLIPLWSQAKRTTLKHFLKSLFS